MSINLDRYRLFIYDFDGVIKQSVQAKTDAFVSMFEEYDWNIKNYVKNYHETNGGVSRYEKFKHYYSFLFDRSLENKELEQLARRFSNAVLDKVVESDYLPGALKTIDKTSRLGKNIICTGTPQTEMKIILNRLEIENFFVDVYGSPKSKSVILSEVLSQYDIPRSEMIYFGDSITDKEAAIKHNIDFVGVNYFNNCVLENSIKDFTEL